MDLCFRWTREERPGSEWLALLGRAWPAYRAWFSAEGTDARPSLAATRRALAEHMPELLGLWEQLMALGDEGAELGRMLGLYCPSAYLSGCSQAVCDLPTPRMVRNYDYSPMLCEATFVHTNWLGTRVMAASDCLWGVLDGINEHGLVVALAFGGRPVVGKGFGIPLILRYVLETCVTTEQAAAVLHRVPSHMAYNVSLLDAAGDRRVALVGPDRPTEVRPVGIATNHQQRLEWLRYDRVARSRERFEFLEAALADPELTVEALTKLFLEPPLYKTEYARGSGTLYTTVYDPGARIVTYVWPEVRIERTLDDFEPGELVVPLGD
jgi:predicted choloylglycine hydrolase